MNLEPPSISLEPVQLETSNLVCGLTDWPTNQKNAKVGQKGRGLRHVTYFYNSGTPFISLEQTKLEISNLVCGLIVGSTIKPKNCKSRSKGVWPTSRDLLFEFCNPIHISGMGAAGDFKFGATSRDLLL